MELAARRAHIYSAFYSLRCVPVTTTTIITIAAIASITVVEGRSEGIHLSEARKGRVGMLEGGWTLLHV